MLIKSLRLAILLVLLPCVTAQARIGDWGEPITINSFPYVHRASTLSRSSQIDGYSCASNLSESGPEVLYRLQIGQSGILNVQLQGDNGQVDVDIHLLSAMTQSGTQASACLARNNRSLEQSLSAGTYYLAVDSYAGAAQAGDYTLNVQFTAEGAWNSRPIAQGVTLETKRYDALFGGSQFGSVIKVDLNTPNVEVKPVRSNGCQTTSQLAQSVGAVAAINGGYFDGTCGSVSLLKIDGRFYNSNARSRSAIGFFQNGTPAIDWIAAGQDWPAVYHALGGLSRLATAGAVDVQWERDSATYGFTHYRNPRTAVGIGDNQELIMATLDGRTSAGLGVSLFDMAQWLVWLGTNDALNLDGGGSTTLWTHTEGVVNYPSDNGLADHNGQRGVANILAVFAPRLQRPSEWVVNGGPSQISVGEQASYEVWARDPDGSWITISAQHNGQGQLNLNNRADGSASLSYRASQFDPPQLTITLQVRNDQDQIDGSQSINLQIFGTTENNAGEMMFGGMETGGMETGGIITEGMEVAGSEMNAGAMTAGTQMQTGGNQMQPAGTEVQAGQIINAGEMAAASDMIYAGTQVPNAGNEQNNNDGSSSPYPNNGGSQMYAGQMSRDPMAGNPSQALPSGIPATPGDGEASCQQGQTSLSLNLILLFLFGLFIYAKNIFYPSAHHRRPRFL